MKLHRRLGIGPDSQVIKDGRSSKG